MSDSPRSVTGEVHVQDFPSRILAAPRTVAVWLPPGYHDDDVTRFPVLYLQDGQNVFDAATAFREEWHVDDTATALIRQRKIAPLIVVGVYNAGDDRVDEYTPSVDAKLARGGGARTYGRMLVEELKPWIDATYRTLPSASSTGLGGSSLGGLAALSLGVCCYTAFGRLALHSPSLWWDGGVAIKQVEELPGKLPLRIWLDAGTAEADSVIPDLRRLRDAFVRKGWTLNEDFAYLEVEGAGHDERAWAARVAPMLRFLYPGTAGPRRARRSRGR